MLLLILENRSEIQEFHNENINLMLSKKGYLENLNKCLLIANDLYKIVSSVGSVPFSLNSAFVVLYFKNVHEIWNHGHDKFDVYNRHMPIRYNFTFTEEELEALTSDKPTPLYEFCWSIGKLASISK